MNGIEQHNIATGRQLRAARVLAGMSQQQFAKAIGVNERAIRYWEARHNEMPTTTTLLDDAEQVLLQRGVIVFARPTPGARLVKLPESGR